MPAPAERWAELLASSPISPSITEQSDRPDNTLSAAASHGSPCPLLPSHPLLSFPHYLYSLSLCCAFWFPPAHLFLTSISPPSFSSSHLSSFPIHPSLSESLSINCTKGISRNSRNFALFKAEFKGSFHRNYKNALLFAVRLVGFQKKFSNIICFEHHKQSFI